MKKRKISKNLKINIFISFNIFILLIKSINFNNYKKYYFEPTKLAEELES